MLKHLHTAIALALFLGATTTPASAQCRPDHLDGGPCCAAANPDLPRFKGFRQDALSICWTDCDIENVISCDAEWKFGNATFPTGGVTRCEPGKARLRLIDAAGLEKWRGTLRLQYSRTWVEFDAAGNQLQVWRYLMNGDLRPDNFTPNNIPCPVPPCVTDYGRARFTGYMDFARDCSAGTANNAVQHAWMLTHACDLIDHNPNFPRGGSYHPDRSYTFVGPGATFSVSPVVAGEGGGSTLEAVRRLRWPTPGTAGGVRCEFEEQIDHNLQPQHQFCLCGGPAAGVPQWQISDLFLGGACGTTITPGSNLLPGFISMGIGTWTAPGTYPGVETLRYNAGAYPYFDPCTGVTRDEVFHGVTTIRGYDAIQLLSNGLGAMLPNIFIDQANSLRNAQATVMNVPYVSDHILNLNH